LDKLTNNGHGVWGIECAIYWLVTTHIWNFEELCIWRCV